MKTFFILTALALTIVSCQNNQTTKKVVSNNISEENEKIQIKNASDFFPTEKTKVLVVGTFHMNYPGLDDHKTTDSDKIDVLKEPKKSELTELVEYIKKFKPTKIAVEAGTDRNITEQLQQYKAGTLKVSRNETQQIGIRIAAELHLDSLYAVDDNPLSEEWYKKDSISLNKMIGNIDWELTDKFDSLYAKWYNYNDKSTVNTKLLKHFKYINSEESHQYGYGHYLTNWFKTEGKGGADFLSIWWYNRNLRIFRNIQDITNNPEERIMVLMGNGHAAVLRQLFEASPEYEFIEFDSL
ncbi:DUF5694 domain-containing protein [Patiriisocius marinus]|uniref:Uncharacterized protein n=1 Tax=Patiriisocius marinus TaxID=1397112 RepID=A0A5J4J1F0_9FLAO|nr:DUF5694 domain-containing protein [Patiriisocius marinus]GER59663.1 hypothetical protein ULMA_17710 [Patiriisocius marinus]